MALGFTDPLTLTELDLNWRLWRVENSFIYERPNGAQIMVPKNFQTDGASVPRFLWTFLPTWGTYSRAAVVHDYLCFLLHYGEPHPEAKTRKQADLVFWEAMQVCKTNLVMRWLLYAGVRIGAHTGGVNIVNYNNPDFLPHRLEPVLDPLHQPTPAEVAQVKKDSPTGDGLP